MRSFLLITSLVLSSILFGCAVDAAEEGDAKAEVKVETQHSVTPAATATSKPKTKVLKDGAITDNEYADWGVDIKN
jgi:hypothetical protein